MNEVTFSILLTTYVISVVRCRVCRVKACLRLCSLVILSGGKDMGQETDQSTIPDEYWPRCDWCGRLLPECSVSHESSFGECVICPVCYSMVGELVKRWAPSWIGEALSKVEDRDEPPYFRTLSVNEIIKMARENMKEAKPT